MTAVRRLRGKDWQPEIAEFGEQVLMRRPRALDQSSLEPRWDPGAYLGTRWGTVEHWVADVCGAAKKAHTIRRRPEASRWDAEKVLGVTGVHDEPDRAGGREGAEGLERPVEVIPHVADPGEEEQIRITRDFCIARSDLQQHCYTRNCAKCDAARAGRKVGTSHSSECRSRFKQICFEAEDGRVQRAQARREDLQAGPAEAPHREGDETEDEGAQEDVEVVEVDVEDEDPMEVCETEVHTPAEEVQDDTEMIVLEGMQKGPPSVDKLDAVQEGMQKGPPSIDKLGNAVKEGMQKGPPSVDKLDAVQEGMQKGPPSINKLGNAAREDLQKGPPSIDKLGNAEVKGDMADMFVRGTAAPLSAKEEIRRLGALGGRPQDKVTELFSPPRVNARLQGGGSNRKVSPGTSVNLVVDETIGESWEFLRADHRRACWARLKEEDPWMVVGSPPCTAFSVLNTGFNKYRSAPEKSAKRELEGKILPWFALDIYAWQVRRGRYFMHEHPGAASSWRLPEVRRVWSMDSVSSTVNDACMFGMVARGMTGSQGQSRSLRDG